MMSHKVKHVINALSPSCPFSFVENQVLLPAVDTPDTVQKRLSAKDPNMFAVDGDSEMHPREDDDGLTWKTCPQVNNLNGCAPTPASVSLSFASSSSNCVRIGISCTSSASSLSPISTIFSLALLTVDDAPAALFGSSKSIKQIAQAALLPSSRTKG